MSISTKSAQKKAPSDKSVFKKQENNKNSLNKQNSPVQDILTLHQTIGNQAVQRLFESGFIQGKLTVGKPNDKYEQEADRVADEVMRMPEPQVQRQTEEKDEKLDIQARISEQTEGGKYEVREGFENRLSRSEGSGNLISDQIRAFVEPRMQFDFSKVHVHTDKEAAHMNQELGARAFTHSRDIYFGADQYKPQSIEGKRLIAHELAHVVQQNALTSNRISPDQTPETKAKATPEVKEVPAAEKTDEELAEDIMNTQLAILVGWDTALQNFDKVLTSASDKETKPDFNKVMKSFLEDKLMGELISRSKVAGAGDAFALLGILTEEMKRASAASESANLRDFYVQHKTAIGKLKQSILALKSDFVAKVRKTREGMEEAEAIAGTHKGSKGKATVTIARSPESEVYGLMRMLLVETIENLDKRLKISTPEDLFRALSEEWIRMVTVRRGLGIRFPAVVVIHLKKDYSVIKAHIQGAGGQKIAEQLLKDSPKGVDVFSMKVKRNIVVLADNGWPSAILNLDKNNRNINTGSFAEGKWMAVERFVMTNGLPPIKKLTGD